MKIDGQEVNNDDAIIGPVVIVRGEKKFGFYACPVWDFEEFNDLCPHPEPPVTSWNAKTGKQERDPKSPAYVQAVSDYGDKRWGYILLKSLEPSKLELPGIDIEDPETWANVESALRKTLSHFEFGQVIKLVEEANSIDAEAMERNKESFLAEAAAKAARDLYPNGEPTSSQSGKPANAGA